MPCWTLQGSSYAGKHAAEIADQALKAVLPMRLELAQCLAQIRHSKTEELQRALIAELGSCKRLNPRAADVKHLFDHFSRVVSKIYRVGQGDPINRAAQPLHQIVNGSIGIGGP